MSNLTKTDPRDITLPGATLTHTGITFDGNLTAEQWANIGQLLERTREAHKWWIGDWLVYGQKRSSLYGHKYDQALSIFQDHTYDELREFASVAESVPPENRRANVSWSHHAAVRSVSIDKQAEFLESGMTRDELRRAVKDFKAESNLWAAPTNTQDGQFGQDGQDDAPAADPTPDEEPIPSDEEGDDEEAGDVVAAGATAGAKDKLGKTVPEDFEDVFEETRWFGVWRRHLSQLLKEAQDISQQPPGAYIRFQELENHVTQAKHLLKFAEPHTLCPGCQASGKQDCKHCRGVGFITRGHMNRLTDKERQWLEQR